MSSSSHAPTDAHDGHDHVEGAVHVHIEPLWLYFGIFGALIVMTVVTVGASYIDFGAANTAIAVLIATVKASLVAVFFMHLRHDKTFNALIFVGGLLFLSFLFLFTLTDTGTRGIVDDFHGHSTEVRGKFVKPVHSAGGGHEAAPHH